MTKYMKTITEIQQQIEQLKQQILEAQQHTPPTYSSEHFSSKNVLHLCTFKTPILNEYFTKNFLVIREKV